jgi:hypothetical protein
MMSFTFFLAKVDHTVNTDEDDAKTITTGVISDFPSDSIENVRMLTDDYFGNPTRDKSMIYDELLQIFPNQDQEQQLIHYYEKPIDLSKKHLRPDIHIKYPCYVYTVVLYDFQNRHCRHTSALPGFQKAARLSHLIENTSRKIRNTYYPDENILSFVTPNTDCSDKLSDNLSESGKVKNSADEIKKFTDVLYEKLLPDELELPKWYVCLVTFDINLHNELESVVRNISKVFGIESEINFIKIDNDKIKRDP